MLRAPLSHAPFSPAPRALPFSTPQHPQDIIDEINSGDLVVEDYEAPAPKE